VRRRRPPPAILSTGKVDRNGERTVRVWLDLIRQRLFEYSLTVSQIAQYQQKQ